MARRIKKTKFAEDKLEEFFDMEPGTTMVEYDGRMPVEASEDSDVVVTDEYDQKDVSIEGQLEEIFDSAMKQFEIQAVEVQQVEGRYRARNGEVAAIFLNTALSAVSKKADIKAHKDKLKMKPASGNGGGTTNNNLVIADRNDLLKALMGKKD
jgi:hypothetical protein